MPKATEIHVSASVGGKAQVVKFEYSEDFHYSQSVTYNVEDLETDQEVDAFKEEQTRKLKGDLEPIAQETVDKLIELRESIRRGDTVVPDPAPPIS
jgi:hypothetical protein